MVLARRDYFSAVLFPSTPKRSPVLVPCVYMSRPRNFGPVPYFIGGPCPSRLFFRSFVSLDSSATLAFTKLVPPALLLRNRFRFYQRHRSLICKVWDKSIASFFVSNSRIFDPTYGIYAFVKTISYLVRVICIHDYSGWANVIELKYIRDII